MQTAPDRMRKREHNGVLPIGTVLGDAYRLVRRLAEGGMSMVYEAEQLRLRKRCAVKVMARELAANREAFSRFFTEYYLIPVGIIFTLMVIFLPQGFLGFLRRRLNQ